MGRGSGGNFNQNVARPQNKTKFKTIKCWNFETGKSNLSFVTIPFRVFIIKSSILTGVIEGFCKYGDKCTYAHGDHELQVVPPQMMGQLMGNGMMPGQGMPNG